MTDPLLAQVKAEISQAIVRVGPDAIKALKRGPLEATVIAFFILGALEDMIKSSAPHIAEMYHDAARQVSDIVAVVYSLKGGEIDVVRRGIDDLHSERKEEGGSRPLWHRQPEDSDG